MTKHEETEQRVADIAEELKEMHEEKLKLSEVQYRLWARMLVTKVPFQQRDSTPSSYDHGQYSTSPDVSEEGH